MHIYALCLTITLCWVYFTYTTYFLFSRQPHKRPDVLNYSCTLELKSSSCMFWTEQRIASLRINPKKCKHPLLTLWPCTQTERGRGNFSFWGAQNRTWWWRWKKEHSLHICSIIHRSIYLFWRSSHRLCSSDAFSTPSKPHPPYG